MATNDEYLKVVQDVTTNIDAMTEGFAVRRMNLLMQVSEDTEAVIAASRLYAKWARDTGDCPHDETGREAHNAILKAVDAMHRTGVALAEK